jgi:PPP family 3-phenylpropionic acid transporter
VVAEILLFAVAGAMIRRLGPTRLLLLAAAAGMIRWTMLGLTTSVGWLALAQLLHAFTFSGTLVAAISYIQQSVPEDQSASAQGLYDGLAMGLFFGIAMAAAGRIYATTPEAAFFLMAALSAVGGLGALLLHRQGTGR